MNKCFQDCIEAQEKGTKFHYAWMLILIALVRWKKKVAINAWVHPEEVIWPGGITTYGI
jgi:hypothetical protein